MRLLTLRLVLGSVLLASISTADAGFLTADFENLTLPPNSYVINPSGTNQTGTYIDSSFTSGGATFNNTFADFGSYNDWYGWAYANVKNVTDPGFDPVSFQLINPVSAYNLPNGTGAEGSANYAVASDFVKNDAFINLPTGYNPVSVQITNTTWAALSMLNGDSFAKKFNATDHDFFKLTITGYSDAGAVGNTLGSVDFYLADYRSTVATLVESWTAVDLHTLGGSKSLGFELTSSDNGAFGMNTPASFALDNLRLSTPSVPEPSSLILIGLGTLGIGLVHLRRKASRA